LKAFPDEHIYSFLYRGYKRFSISGHHTIINPEGLFKQRIALIPPEYIHPFVRNGAELSRLCDRSGFFLFSCRFNAQSHGRPQANYERELGLRVMPSNKKSAHPLRYCSQCIHDFIRDHGVAFLLSDWLNDIDTCNTHGTKIMQPMLKNRAEAVKCLNSIFLGKEEYLGEF